MAAARRDFITPDICTKCKDLGRNGTSEMLFVELHPFLFGKLLLTLLDGLNFQGLPYSYPILWETAWLGDLIIY